MQQGDIDYELIGNRIREKRQKAKLTQEQLAEQLDVVPEYMPIIVYQALKGKESPWKECLRFVRNFIFTASYGQLWYLPAAMLAIFLVWVCLEKCLSWRNNFAG